MKTAIVNIHGFNSGPGGKFDELKKQFPTSEVFCPQLSGDNPTNDILILQQLVASLNGKDIHVVGTSLGGLYAMYLSVLFCHRDDITYYIINPAYQFTIEKHLGTTLLNYKTNTPTTITQDTIRGLDEIKYAVSKYFDSQAVCSCNFYIGSQDDSLQFDELHILLQQLQSPYKLYTSPQGHRFQDISQIVQHIKQNMVL